MTREEASNKYIERFLQDNRDYLGCEKHRRMTLIQKDLYDIQQAFEDGWEAACKENFKSNNKEE